MATPKIMFYHDGRHPLIYMYEPPMLKEEYEAAVDELAGTPVEALMFCLGDGRTFLHDTKVGEIWGHNVERWRHLVFQRAHRNARALIDEGNDPLRIVCDRAHAKGMLIYPTLLVQQGSGERGVDSRSSDYRYDNKHLEIGAQGGVDRSWRGFECLDFAREEVREERFAIIEETLRKYPVDGFELQLNYTPYYFHPNRVDQGREIMTAWIARVHDEVKRSGAGRELAIRVPASVEGCLSVGLDLEDWIRKGIVDVLIGQTMSVPELVNPMADFTPLVDAAKGSATRVHAAIHSNVDSDRISEATTEMTRAAACNYWAQGIDGLYLAHWFSYWPYEAPFYEKLRELPHPDVMAPKDKIYHIPTESGRYPRPVTEPGVTTHLPTALAPDRPAVLEMRVSDDLHRWDRDGRVHEVLLRVRVMNVNERNRIRLTLNGKEVPQSLLRSINQIYRMIAPRYRTGYGYWYVYRLDRDHWPVQGLNTLEVALTEYDDEVTVEPYVRDVELETRYLQGKNFHRGNDPDLGPIEYASARQG